MSKELINAVAASVNADPTQFATVIGDNDTVDISKLATLVRQSVQSQIDAARLKEQEKQENLLKKAIKERMTANEAKLREVFELPETIEGDDLINAVSEQRRVLLTKDADPDKIKSSPVYIQGVKEAADQATKVMKARLEEVENEFNSFKTDTEYRTVTSKVKDQAIQTFTTAPIRDDVDAELRNSWMELYTERILGRQKWRDVNGELVPVDDKGEQIRNANGLPMTLKEVLDAELRKVAPLKASSDRSGAGGDGGNGKPGAKPILPEGWAGPALPTKKEEVDEFRKQALQGIASGKVSAEHYAQVSQSVKEMFAE